MYRTALRLTVLFLALGLLAGTSGAAETRPNLIFQPGELSPRDSQLRVKVGDVAPDFILPSVGGEKVALSSYRGKKNVVLSFVPAAFTPVCSGQWPRFDADKDYFAKYDAELLGITVDNVPTLYAWTKSIDLDGGGMWFPVLSDFYPHGDVAQTYGVLRTSGVSERALVLIDKEGVIRYIEVYDINKMPTYVGFEKALESLKQ